MKTSRGKYFSLSNILMYLFLVVIVLLSIFPFYWMLAATTNMTVDIIKGRIWFGTYFVENFKTLINQTHILRAFWNSMKNSIIGTFSSLFICSMAGYGFQIFRDKAKDRVMSILLLSMMVPFAAVMVPLYRMFAQAHLLNTTAAFVLPSVSTAFLIFFFRQSAHTFPLELVQAARVDGLGEFNIYLRIFFPVMAPTFAAAAIVNFMGHWNDYMWPLVIQQTQASQTLAILTANLMDPYDTDYGELMLAITIYTVPMLIIFIRSEGFNTPPFRAFLGY
jgi:lactose/L-arabinose transport system permease protein